MTTDTLARPAADERPGAEPAEAARPRVKLVFTALLMAILLAALDQTIVATALPKIVGDLDGLDHMSWVVTAYLLASTVGLPLYGKAGDLLGRKGVFQFAIVTFLVGSALAGVSRSMDQLIAFRALQGVGGGGLMIGAQAIIGDLVPPRERGRYMGAIGGVFAVASVAGPLLGGTFTDHASWRWCFYVNLPLGVVTLIVTAVALRLPKPTRRPRFDLLGALLLAVGSCCLVLLTTWGGTRYAWGSKEILVLGAATAGCALAFVLVEHLVAEPVIPLRLFRDSVFTMAGLIGLLVGAALFGAASYLPTFLQMVMGVTATGSGLLMLPMMGGLLVASTLSGQLIARTGRYKIYPILGCAVSAAGMALLSRMGVSTTRLSSGIDMAVLGVGIGLVMPTLVLVVQNAAPRKDLGTATSANNFLRQIGGSLGAAAFGSLFASRLTARLSENPPHGLDHLPSANAITPQLVRQLPAEARHFFVSGYASAMPPIFGYLVPVLVLGTLLGFFLKEKTLQTNPTPAEGEGEGSLPLPTQAAKARSASAEHQLIVNGTDFTLPADETARRAVHGRVTDAEGGPLGRAVLTVVDAAGHQVGRATARADGGFIVAVPEPGAYVLIAAAPGRRPYAGTVVVGNRLVDVDVVLRSGRSLTGSVRDAEGVAVTGANVTLTDQLGEVVASARTSADGGYLLDDLAAGEYTLAASAPGLRPVAVPLRVREDGPQRKDVTLVGAASLRGSVHAERDGRPLADVRVTLLDSVGNVVAETLTEEDGGYGFCDLAPGTYTVIAAGYPPVAADLRVVPGRGERHDVRLGHEPLPTTG